MLNMRKAHAVPNLELSLFTKVLLVFIAFSFQENTTLGEGEN